jgi:hypothetical protein
MTEYYHMTPEELYTEVDLSLTDIIAACREAEREERAIALLQRLKEALNELYEDDRSFFLSGITRTERLRELEFELDELHAYVDQLEHHPDIAAALRAKQLSGELPWRPSDAQLRVLRKRRSFTRNGDDNV